MRFRNENVPVDGEYTPTYTGFRLTAITAGTFSWSSTSPRQEYSLDGGQTWTQYSVAGAEISLSAGQSICLRRYTATSPISIKIGLLYLTGTWEAGGNLLSLLVSSGWDSMTDISGWGSSSAGIFEKIFNAQTGIVSAATLRIPVTTLGQRACYQMFRDCTGLTTVNSALLPATTLAASCYWDCFRGCTALTNAPDLPASTLVSGCYANMFYQCGQVSSIKALATSGFDATNAKVSFLRDTAATGTFTKAAAASTTDWSVGYDGIPSGWTVQDV